MSDQYVPNLRHPTLDDTWKVIMQVPVLPVATRLSPTSLRVHRAVLTGHQDDLATANAQSVFVGSAADSLPNEIEPDGEFTIEDPLGREFDLYDWFVLNNVAGDGVCIQYKQ